MKKLFVIVVGLAMTGSFVAAQSQSVKNVRGRFELSQDTKAGSALLKAGRYEVASKGSELTFRKLVQDPTMGTQWNFDMKEKPVVVTCDASVLPEKTKGTRLQIPTESGGAVLQTLAVDGTNVLFTCSK